MSPQPPSFFSRIALAIGSFFAILGDARLAQGVARLRAGEALAADVPPREVRIEVPVETIVETRIEVPVERVVEKIVESHSPSAALQLLGLLQRQARFVDFVQEGLAGYSDADIGVAARVVHEGCRKVLAEHFSITPIRSEAEGSRVTLPAGFDASAVRVSGHLVGQPPFTGTLVHRGWQAGPVRLPQLTDAQAARILAQAEVEL
ncbi:DUF2760 domain-containing protein [Melaminivora sp.]